MSDILDNYFTKNKSLNSIEDLFRFFESVVKNQMYFPKLPQLNDKFEATFNPASMGKISGNSLSFLKAMRAKDNFRVFFVTANPANILLWNTYSNRMSGYSYVFSKSGRFKNAQEVRYVHSPNGISKTDLAKNVLLYKSIDWSHENEYRLIGSEKSRGYIKLKDELHGVIIPLHTRTPLLMVLTDFAVAYKLNLYFIKPVKDQFKLEILELKDVLSTHARLTALAAHGRGFENKDKQIIIGELERLTKAYPKQKHKIEKVLGGFALTKLNG